MKTSRIAIIAGALVLSSVLAACGGGGKTENQSIAGGDDGREKITLGGWSLATTPEFQVMIDGFNASQDKYELEISEYDATDFDTQLMADLSAGTAPDVITLKNFIAFDTYQSANTLLDVTDIVDSLPKIAEASDPYNVDDRYFAVPYRFDAWLLFYNKTLFDQAGIEYPDATWTWEDFSEKAQELASKLGEVNGAYIHNWQYPVQSFALQTPESDFMSGDYGYTAPYYERILALQDSGAIVDFGTITTNQLTYQGQFGTQEAAMMPMGSWYVATLLTQQEDGTADQFEWGIAPVPQYDETTTGTDAVPVTFGAPTAITINASIDESKLEGAKEFLKYVGSSEFAVELAKIGITPAQVGDEVIDAFFSIDGIPTDDISKFAMGNREIKLQNAVDPHAAEIENALKDMHSSIMTKEVSIEEGISSANERVQNEILGQ